MKIIPFFIVLCMVPVSGALANDVSTEAPSVVIDSPSEVPVLTREEEEPESRDEPFKRGSRFWSFTTGASYDKKLGHIYVTQFNVSHYVLDNLAFHYGATLGYAFPKRTRDGLQGGPEIGMRWHFARTQRWSVYVEGLAAAVIHRHPLTERSLRFNFDLQPGMGMTYRFSNRSMIQSGFRWHHLSNARVRGKARNLGYDGPMAYVGWMRSF